MLILTRRLRETMVIGDDVNITILGIKGNQVRLGFDAPEDVIIHRHEIYQKIKAQQTMLLKKPCEWRQKKNIQAH